MSIFFFEPIKSYPQNNTTFLFGSDSIEKLKKRIESCISNCRNSSRVGMRVGEVSASLLSFCTTRVPCCNITDSEKRQFEQQMEKNVNSIEQLLSSNGFYGDWLGFNNSMETIESEHSLLAQLLDTILQRGKTINIPSIS